jgi:hypothetical protein
MFCIGRIVKLTTSKVRKSLFFLRNNNEAAPFKHKTLVIDTQLVLQSPGCISLDLIIKALTTCDQALEHVNAEIESQIVNTALIASHAFSLAGDTNALVRLLVFCSNSVCSFDND